MVLMKPKKRVMHRLLFDIDLWKKYSLVSGDYCHIAVWIRLERILNVLRNRSFVGVTTHNYANILQKAACSARLQPKDTLRLLYSFWPYLITSTTPFIFALLFALTSISQAKLTSFLYFCFLVKFRPYWTQSSFFCGEKLITQCYSYFLWLGTVFVEPNCWYFF